MNSSSPRIYPSDPVAMDAFRRMALAPDDEKPIVEMNDETARNINIIWDSINARAAKWRGGNDIHFPDMPMDRKAFWGAFNAEHTPAPLPVADEFIRASSGAGKVAIDLGCGNSPATVLLLEKGWNVIAVDNSRASLNLLARKHRGALETGQLTIIESDVTEFTPSEPVDLVVAADILPYINPIHFRSTWTKIHQFIKQEGFFIGNLFRSISDPLVMMNTMREMGAWFLPDRRMVRPLLTHMGYDIQTCRFRIDDPGMEAMCIQFIAKKKALPVSEF